MSAPWWISYILDVRFLDGGRIYPDLDCWGLPLAVFERELKIKLPDWAELCLKDLFNGAISLLEDRFTTGFSPIEIGAESAFDVAIMRRPINIGGKMKLGWWHTGVITRPGHILHAEEGMGCVEQAFRNTPQSSAVATLRPKDVQIWRHKDLFDNSAAMRACA